MGIKEGVYEGSVNETLLGEDFYNIEHLELNTFAGWKALGYSVRKGEKGYLVWAKPKALAKGQPEPKPESEEQEEKWFPTCYLFTSLQVEKIGKEVAA